MVERLGKKHQVVDRDGDIVLEARYLGTITGEVTSHNMVEVTLKDYSNWFRYNIHQLLLEDIVSDDEVNGAIRSILNARQ